MEKEEKEEKEKKVVEKKSNIWMIISIVLFLIVLGLGAYVGYDKLVVSKQGTNTESKEDSTKNVREDLSTTDFTVQKLIKIFGISNNRSIGISGDFSANTAKLYLAMGRLNEGDFTIVSCSKVGGYVIHEGRYSYCSSYRENDFYAVYDQPEAAKELIEKKAFTKAVSSSIVKAKVEELFGSDYAYKPEDFSATIGYMPSGACQIWHYDKANDIYAFYGGACGGSTVYFEEEIVSAYKEGNYLYIETKTIESSDTEYLPNGVSIKYQFKKDAKNGNYVYATSPLSPIK